MLKRLTRVRRPFTRSLSTALHPLPSPGSTPQVADDLSKNSDTPRPPAEATTPDPTPSPSTSTVDALTKLEDLLDAVRAKQRAARTGRPSSPAPAENGAPSDRGQYGRGLWQGLLAKRPPRRTLRDATEDSGRTAEGQRDGAPFPQFPRGWSASHVSGGPGQHVPRNAAGAAARLVAEQRSDGELAVELTRRETTKALNESREVGMGWLRPDPTWNQLSIKRRKDFLFGFAANNPGVAEADQLERARKYYEQQRNLKNQSPKKGDVIVKGDGVAFTPLGRPAPRKRPVVTAEGSVTKVPPPPKASSSPPTPRPQRSTMPLLAGFAQRLSPSSPSLSAESESAKPQRPPRAKSPKLPLTSPTLRPTPNPTSPPPRPTSTPTSTPKNTAPSETKINRRDVPPHLGVRTPPPTPTRIPPEDVTLSSYPHTLSSAHLASSIIPLTPSYPRPPIATLAHGLDRVLFNPGVHFLRDPRSGVYNFPPTTLESVPRLEDFEFEKLPAYITSSKDEALLALAVKEGKTWVGSTSTSVGMLCQIYFWLSRFREVNTSMLSERWQDQPRTFSAGQQQVPAAVILHYKEGKYAIDADKSLDPTGGHNVLSEYGKLMEKLLTTEPAEFSRFLKSSPDPAPSELNDPQAYHYTQTEHMILRSQLDAQNEFLPNVTFDVKTRASIAIRQDRLNYEAAAGYEINTLRGAWNSYEREYYDLIRSAFLKYSMQTRIGGMDGVIVAYHSTARFFGFQYIPNSEMDEALYGTPSVGDDVFRICVGMLENILAEITAIHPGQSIKAAFQADQKANILRIFVQPYDPTADKDAVGPIPTILEFSGTSFYHVGDRSQAAPLGETFERPWAKPVDGWSTGYNVAKRVGGDDVGERDYIWSRFKAVRAAQAMFSQLTLPEGVTEKQILEAAVNAAKAGAKLDPSDLSLRFPFSKGLSYNTRPSGTVKILRRLALKGREETLARAAEEPTGTQADKEEK